MTKVYVAAPFAAATDGERYLNVVRAMQVGEILTRMDWYEPVAVHERIYDGEWGDDNDPEARAAGMKATMAILDDVLDNGGRVAVLLRDDCTMSAGTAAEVKHAVERGADVIAMTWNCWQFVDKMNKGNR